MNAIIEKRPGVVPTNAIGLVPKMLSHAAYVTHDAAATADFYTRILGMELGNTIIDDRIPSTGDPFPYFHLFFRMADGSTIAFFESPGLPPPAPATHPAYDIFNHIALEVESPAEIRRWRDWLIQNGIEVIGPTDHEGLILSIYFRDPSGHRLELTTPLQPDWNRHGDQARRELQLWQTWKDEARKQQRPLENVLVERIREHLKR